MLVSPSYRESINKVILYEILSFDCCKYAKVSLEFIETFDLLSIGKYLKEIFAFIELLQSIEGISL